MFQKILIANRGEIAVRIAKTCLAMGIQPVFVYSDVDANLPYIRAADEAYRIGPAPAKDSYLNQDSLLAAAANSGCQAVHPGYGFLSENSVFAQRCLDAKICWIGPSPRHIRQMGDKDVARQTMKYLKVPVIPGSNLLDNSEEAGREAERLGYPVLLKARAGGGGKGMRLVEAPSALKTAFEDASREAHSAFSDGALYLEKYYSRARHVEFQILGDQFGNVMHLGERECSIQRKHQKLFEESPANNLSAKKRELLGRKICEALSKVGYRNAGTMEFLVDEKDNYFFMEMNTRLQVEHPVTEMVTGVDLVAAQIRLACGQKLASAVPKYQSSGHAMEFRINAEDPSNHFSPSPGMLAELTGINGGDGNVRFDTFCESGIEISPYYDSMIGKLVVKGPNREKCMSRAKLILNQLTIKGIKTTTHFHRALLENASLKSGNYTTSTQIEI